MDWVGTTQVNAASLLARDTFIGYHCERHSMAQSSGKGPGWEFLEYKFGGTFSHPCILGGMMRHTLASGIGITAPMQRQELRL